MKRWLYQLAIGFISRFVPKRGKRIIFITLCYALWSKVNDETQMKHEMIEINNILGLARDEESLQFAIVLQKLLLESDDLKPLTKCPREDLRDKIIERLPECDWLQYNDENTVLADLSIVFNPRYCR